MSRTWKRHLSILFVLLLAVSAPTFAQTFRGTVTGPVVDIQGAVSRAHPWNLTNPGTSFVLTRQIEQQRRVPLSPNCRSESIS